MSIMVNTNSLSLDELGRSFKIKTRATQNGGEETTRSATDFLREKYMKDLMVYASSPDKKRKKMLKRFISVPVTEHRFRRVAGHVGTKAKVVKDLNK